MKQAAWAPKGLEVMGSVLLPTAQVLTNNLYLERLRERVDEMESDPSDLQQASDLLVEAGLLQFPLDPQESLGRQMVTDNESMQEHLRTLGIPGELPLKAVFSNKAAQSAIDQTSLIAWTLEAVSGRIRRE
jgi:hypothetical protein